MFEKRWKTHLILSLVLVICFIHLPNVYTFFYHELTNINKAANGSINLSAADPCNKIYLDGQWAFYWDRFIATEPEQLHSPDVIINVPDSWSNYVVNGKQLSSRGFGSYKLKFTGLYYDKPVTLYIPDFGGAYRVFIDGQLAAESGTAVKNTDEIFTVPKAELYPIMLSENMDHEAIIEVATTRFSGLYMTPVLQDYYQTLSVNNIRYAMRFILFGIALFSFFCMIIMYAVSVRRKPYFSWLPIMVLFILMRSMLTSDFYSFWQPVLFFNVSYESTNELMYFVTFALKYLLIFLVQEQCGLNFAKREKAGFLIYYVILYSIYLFTPQDVYNKHMSVIVPMLTYVLDIYLFIKIYRNWEQIKKFGIPVIWSAALVISGITIDSYYINGKIYMNMSLALLLFFTIASFVICWAYAMSVGDLYDDFTKTSSRLAFANNQIAMQKEYYDALTGQMNEIREMKHDMRHFLGVITRLINEHKLEELESFLSDYSQKTEMEALPLFCENAIVNSIIGYYFMQAKKDGIRFESGCNIRVQKTMNDSDLCIVMGNALENAIDACRRMDDEEIRFVSLEAGSIKGQLLIKVSNSYNGMLIIKDGQYISSKKGKSHGLGIPSLRRIVESYGGFLKTEHSEKAFVLMVAVPEK